jgi:hypothetical protein
MRIRRMMGEMIFKNEHSEVSRRPQSKMEGREGKSFCHRRRSESTHIYHVRCKCCIHGPKYGRSLAGSQAARRYNVVSTDRPYKAPVDTMWFRRAGGWRKLLIGCDRGDRCHMVPTADPLVTAPLI